MYKLRDITASFYVNNSDVQNADTYKVDEEKEDLLASEANDFIQKSVCPLIELTAMKGIFFTIVGIPERIRPYVIDILTYDYFFNVSKINGGYKISWETVDYYKYVEQPTGEELDAGLYYEKKLMKSYSTVNIYYYEQTYDAHVAEYYTKEHLGKYEVI